MMNVFTETRLTCVVALFLTIAIQDAAAQEQTFPTANCAWTPPANWRLKALKDQPHVVACYGDSNGNRTLIVLADKRGTAATSMSADFVAAYDKGVDNVGGGTKTAGKFVEIAGFQAYERRGERVLRGRNMTTVSLAIPTGDGIYVLDALSAHTDAADDEEIRQSINTFRFLHPPGAPRQPRDAAFQAGYIAGQGFVGVAALGLIIWGITKLVTRRHPPSSAGFSGPYPFPPPVYPPMPPASRPNPGEPPPLPPGAAGTAPKRYEY